jgi:hypothetical protein
MSTGTNESEETVNDRNSRGSLAPGPAPVPANPKANGPEPVVGHPVTAPETYPAVGAPTIAPGPAEEEDRREPDDRGLTTDAGSSD